MALTETYPAVGRNPRLSVTPLVQPPTLHYRLGASELVSDEPYVMEGDVGVFVVENELSRGFFLIWGYGHVDDEEDEEEAAYRHHAEGHHHGQAKPWCRVLPWKGPASAGGGASSSSSLSSASRTEVHLQGEPDIFVLDRDPVELFSARETFMEMMKRFRQKRSDGRLVDVGDVVVRPTFRPDTFLGYTRYSLVVEIEPARAVDKSPMQQRLGADERWRKRKETWWERFSPPHLMIMAKKKAVEWC